MPVYKDENKTKKGNQYYFMVFYIDTLGNRQRYKSKKFKTKAEAIKAESEYRMTIGVHMSNDMTFNDLAAEYRHYKQETIKPQSMRDLDICSRHICSVLGPIKVCKLSAPAYEQFRQYLVKQNFSVSYKNKVNKQLKAMLKFSKRRFGVGSDVPDRYDAFKDTSIKKEMDFFTLEEFKSFIECIDDVRYHSLFLVLFYMGLRLGEANSLTWDDINDNTLSVRKTVNTKIRDNSGEYLITSPKTASSVRDLPMPQIVSNALNELHEYYSVFDGFDSSWFVFGGLKALPESSIQSAKNKACDSAGLRRIRIHDFRHSCASLLINQCHGASVLLVSKYLGHGNVQITLNTYAHLWKSELIQIASEIDKIA